MTEPATEFDLVVAGGIVVTERDRFLANVGIRGSTVVAVSTEALPGRRVIDATGLLVLPGGIDAHTHFNSVWPFPDERRPADDFRSGTAGAAAGGVTTVCDFVYPLEGEGLQEALVRVRAAAASAHVDVALHVAITTLTGSSIGEVAGVVSAGCPSFKFYTLHPDFVANRLGYLALLARIGELAGVAMFHCEDPDLLATASEMLRASGRYAPRFYPLSKPVEVEAAATSDAIALAAEAGVASYIVHLSSAAALDAVLVARSNGVRVFAETRPLYLYLTAERYDATDEVAARFIGTPPLRDAADRDRLWAALADGTIDTVGSDHVGFTKEQKYRPGDTFETVPKGSASVETLLPMLYSVGVREGRITPERLVQLTATNPARIFGLYPRKGTVSVGADADLCVFDPRSRRRLSGGLLHSAADLEPFEGMEVAGAVAYTISRGTVVYEGGVVVGSAGHGRFVPGLGAAGGHH